MIWRAWRRVSIPALAVFLLVFQVALLAAPLNTLVEPAAVSNEWPADYTTSGIEILFGGDYSVHDVTAWENVDDVWQDDYSFDVYDPGFGLVNDLIITDVDGDGDNEVIVGNSGDLVQIYEYQDGVMVLSHNLTHPTWDGCQVHSVAAGDLDNDGGPDLEILASVGSHFHSVVFKMVGDTYCPVFNISSTDPRNVWGTACAVGDLDNNGDLEFLVTEEFPDADGVSRLRLYDWQTDHWENIRNYGFVTGDFLNHVDQVQIADVDNDDENEVLVNQDQELVHVLEYTGGVFVKSWSCPLLSEQPNCVMAGDITGDELIDIVVPDPVADLIYIYETVDDSIVNTFNISLVHDNHWYSGGYTSIDIDDLDGDGVNEWVFLYWNETAFPHEWFTIFRNDTVIQQCQTGYLYASTIEIGNYDNDEAETVVVPTTSATSSTSTTTTTGGTSGGLPISPELLAIAVGIPVAVILIALVVRRQRG